MSNKQKYTSSWPEHSIRHKYQSYYNIGSQKLESVWFLEPLFYVVMKYIRSMQTKPKQRILFMCLSNYMNQLDNNLSEDLV